MVLTCDNSCDVGDNSFGWREKFLAEELNRRTVEQRAAELEHMRHPWSVSTVRRPLVLGDKD